MIFELVVYLGLRRSPRTDSPNPSSSSMVLNLVGGAEPHPFHTRIHRTRADKSYREPRESGVCLDLCRTPDTGSPKPRGSIEPRFRTSGQVHVKVPHLFFCLHESRAKILRVSRLHKVLVKILLLDCRVLVSLERGDDR